MTQVRHHAVAVPATTANLGPGFDAFGLALGERAVDRSGVARLTVRSVPRATQPERVTTVGEGEAEVSSGDDNLVWRSLLTFCEHHGVPVPDVAVQVRNRIPLERGLGSSSAAIVAGLVLGRALTEVVVGDRELLGLASSIEGHPDNVGPALLGGLVACATDDAGDLVVRRVNPSPSLQPVVLVPVTRQATTSARAVLPEHLPRAEVTVQAARAGHVLAALSGVWPAAVGLAGDRLHEPARFASMPATGAVVSALRDAGIHAWLSGAGPAVAAVMPAAAESSAIAEIAEAHGFVAHQLTVDLAGAFACPDDGCGLSGSGNCVQCPHRRV